MARKFFYVCTGMLMLALSYHFGFTTASAQAPSNPVVATNGNVVFTANGDIYSNGGLVPPYEHVGNIFASGPAPARRESWGQLKSRYAPKGGTVSKSADTR